jgi:O-antigen/teichoic acid export membrane protein
VANLLSYTLLFVLGIRVVNQIIDYDWKYLLWSAIKMVVACALMYLVVFLIKERTHFIIAVACGGLTYFAATQISSCPPFVFPVRECKTSG